MNNFFRPALICLIPSLWIVSVVVSDEPDPEASLQVDTKRSNDRVVVSTKKEAVVLDIHSPFGISLASLKPVHDKWPKSISLRLHLRGLECFTVKSDDIKLELNVFSSNQSVHQALGSHENRQPLKKGDDYWIAIKKIGADGEPQARVPLTGGYFEIELPKKLLESNPESIRVEWIDFYR